jgi:hypothetical protein
MTVRDRLRRGLRPARGNFVRIKACLNEHVDLLRDVIHDATAPADDQLRRGARQLLWILTCVAVTMVGTGVLVYEVLS